MGSSSFQQWLKDLDIGQLVWAGVGVERFKTLKDAIGKAAVQVWPEEGSEYVIHSGTRQYVVGVTLSQKGQDRHTRLIAFLHRMLKRAKTRYPTYNK
jgi:hypothetical protein